MEGGTEVRKAGSGRGYQMDDSERDSTRNSLSNRIDPKLFKTLDRRPFYPKLSLGCQRRKSEMLKKRVCVAVKEPSRISAAELGARKERIQADGRRVAQDLPFNLLGSSSGESGDCFFGNYRLM